MPYSRRLAHPSRLICFIAVLACLATTAAAETREVGGKVFMGVAGDWQQVEADGARFDVDPRVITMKLAPGVSAAAESSLHDSLGGRVLRRARTGFVDVELSRGQDVLDAVESYRASGLVAVVEPTTIGRYTVVPNDTSYASQWPPPIVDAEEAWDITSGSTSIIVAVLDSGTEFEHDDLGLGSDGYQNVWLNPGEDAWSDPTDPSTGNGLDDDMNGYVDDWKGYDFSNGNNDPEGPFFHGTAVAGVVAAKTNNALGMAGMAGGFGAAGSQVLIAGVGDAAPNGSVLDDAMIYAAEAGAHVIQLSLTVGSSAAIDAAIDMVHDTYGMTVVCASGNGGGSSVGYPSSNVKVIAVGSTTSADLRSSFSQHGPDLDFSAPGSSIYTLDLNDGYLVTSGTSFAAPLVSGVVALMLSVNPSLTNTQIRQILRDTADKVGGYNYDWNMSLPGHSFELGYGRVNAHEAVLAAGPDAIFADGFESGNTSNWSATVP